MARRTLPAVSDDQAHPPAPTFRLGGATEVHRLGFGAMRLTGWDRTDGPADAIAIARRAVELGVTLIDTADSYGLGANEELLAEALHPYPSDLVIATKAGQSRPDRGSWVPLGRPEYLHQQAELSRRRLRVDCLDLFQLHRIDPAVPLPDQVGVLDELRRAGKVRYVGLSEVTVEQVRAAQSVTRIDSVQNLYNVTDRHYDDVVDHCAAHAIAFLPWKPVNYGDVGDASGPLQTIGRELGASPVQVALAWLLARSPVVVPIPGTSSLDHLEQNVASSQLRLDAHDLELLDDLPGATGPVGI